MAKEKVYIGVYKGASFVGYIKSVSYKNRTYKTVPTKLQNPKGYTTQDKLMGDIDTITTPETVAKGITFVWG